MRRDGAEYVGCLEPEDGNYDDCESSTTYIHGFREAATRMNVAIAIYENVATVMHRRKDKKGLEHAPPMEQIENDMTARGFTWQARVLDTQDFLLPQRRNRC